MNKFIFNEEEKITMKSLGIDVLVLFGSQAKGTSGPFSDFDFGIILKNKAAIYIPQERRKIYDALYDILERHINQLVNIDIVFLEDAPYDLRAHVMKYGKLLFEDTPGTFTNFKALTMLLYADFAPLREMFQKATLARIK